MNANITARATHVAAIKQNIKRRGRGVIMLVKVDNKVRRKAIGIHLRLQKWIRRKAIDTHLLWGLLA